MDKVKKGKALVKNASDPKQVNKAGRDEKELRRREREDIKFLLADGRGRRFLWKYLSKCGIYKTSFGEGNDRTNYYEGQRSVGLMLLSEILDVDPEGYTKLIEENREIEDVDEEEPDDKQD